MNCHRPHLKRWFCALLLAGAAAGTASAQESMVFSKPADLPTDKANDFMGDQHRNIGAINSAASLSGNTAQASFDILPGAQRLKPPSPDAVKQMQKFLDDKKNWTLLTPEQILGVPSPEQIMGLPDPSQQDNLTAEQRWMNRQDQQRNFSATNAMSQPDNSWERNENPFQLQNSDTQKSRQSERTGMWSDNYSRQRMNGSSALLRNTDPGKDPSSQDADQIWHSAFPVMPPAPKPDPEQVAAMERFRAMMDPTPEAKPADFSSYSTAPVTVPDPNMQPMPAYNPVGHSFNTIQDTAGRPMGINPLPTITGQTANQITPKAQPLVKLPPWLSKEPQLGKPMQQPF